MTTGGDALVVVACGELLVELDVVGELETTEVPVEMVELGWVETIGAPVAGPQAAVITAPLAKIANMNFLLVLRGVVLSVDN